MNGTDVVLFINSHYVLLFYHHLIFVRHCNCDVRCNNYYRQLLINQLFYYIININVKDTWLKRGYYHNTNSLNRYSVTPWLIISNGQALFV